MDDPSDERQISRRKALQRGAVIGALVWTPPVVSSFRLPAAGLVGSPAPEPSPTETPTTPPVEPPSTPTPTATPTPRPSSTSKPPVEVGGSGTEVAGDALARTGQSLAGQATAGAALTAFGTVLRLVAKRRPDRDSEDPTRSTPNSDAP